MTYPTGILSLCIVCIIETCLAQNAPRPVLQPEDRAHKRGDGKVTTGRPDTSPMTGDEQTITRTHTIWKTADGEFQGEFWEKYNLALSDTAGAKEAFCANADSYQKRIDQSCAGTSGSECKPGLQQLMQQWIDAKRSYYQDELARAQKNKLHVEALLADTEREDSDCGDSLDDAQKLLSKHEEEKRRFSQEIAKTPEDNNLRKALAKLDDIIVTDNDSIKYATNCKTDVSNQRENLGIVVQDSRQTVKIVEAEKSLTASQGRYYESHYSTLWTFVEQLCVPPPPKTSKELDGERPPQ